MQKDICAISRINTRRTMYWKTTINVLAFSFIGCFSATVIASDDQSASQSEFLGCLNATGYDDELTTQKLAECLQKVDEDRWPELCIKLTDTSREYGPVCWETVIRDLPVKCTETSSGQKELAKLHTNVLIMQLDHCIKSYQSKSERLTKVLLQSQGVSFTNEIPKSNS